MKHVFISLFFMISLGNAKMCEVKSECIQIKNSKYNNVSKLKKRISKELANCVPNNWTVYEDYNEENKLYLAHIGKGDFELHLKSNQIVVDTIFDLLLNKRIRLESYPEITLYFYPNKEKTKKIVKSVQENQSKISNINIPDYFGETSKFLIYERKKLQQPGEKVNEIRNCLKEVIGNH